MTKKKNVSFAEKLFVVAAHNIKKSSRNTGRKLASAGRKLAIVLALVVPLCAFGSFYGILRVKIMISKNYYDRDRAVKMITANAQTYSRGLCAMYVRSAIEQAGAPTFGYPGHACDYVDFLPKLGFRKIATHQSRDYKPSAGDIMVFASKPGHRSGHIAMYNGKMWVSDFKQTKGMWVAKVYEQEPDWTVFSRETGWDRRSVRWSDINRYFTDGEFRNYTRRRWERMPGH